MIKLSFTDVWHEATLNEIAWAHSSDDASAPAVCAPRSGLVWTSSTPNFDLVNFAGVRHVKLQECLASS